MIVALVDVDGNEVIACGVAAVALAVTGAVVTGRLSSSLRTRGSRKLRGAWLFAEETTVGTTLTVEGKLAETVEISVAYKHAVRTELFPSDDYLSRTADILHRLLE